MDRKVKIVQETKHRWRIENAEGLTILKDLTLESAYRAEEYIKNYISSFIAYNYEVVPLKEIK